MELEKTFHDGDKAKESKSVEKLMLEPNHNYFLLIDNGTVGKATIEYDFRIRLESALDKMWESDKGNF